MRLDPKKFDWNEVGLDFGNWEEEKLWALPLPVTSIDISELLWHLDCPWWESDSGERYTVTPRDVIELAPGTSTERAKVQQADTSYPIDIFYNKDKWLILDGIHRLVKLYQEGVGQVQVRIVTNEVFPSIASSEPIELPNW